MQKKLYILGAGAIGQLIAHKLTQASIDCQFIVHHSEKYSAPKWQLEQEDDIFEQSIPLSDATEKSPIALLCVTVKGPQLLDALASIAHRLDNNSQVILFQNGMGHEAIATQFIQANQLYFASNTHGVFKRSNQSIVYAGKGSLQIGSLTTQDPSDWFSLFANSELNSSWSTNIEPILYRKLLVNACINPLTALYQCKNGQLLNAPYKKRLLALINENGRFAEKIGLSFETDLKQLVQMVIEQTADNYNSMYQDVKAGRETEINAINGFLLEQMQAHNFHSPQNWQLWSEFHIAFPPRKKIAEQKLIQLNQTQYQVTQQKGTEAPFTGTYYQHKSNGDYLCICCDSLLFDSKGKFDSHCGWPSFDKAQNNKAIAYQTDDSHNMHRTEILCAQCGAHLGHIFDDGPTNTGQRFCVNSASLQFIKQAD